MACSVSIMSGDSVGKNQTAMDDLGGCELEYLKASTCTHLVHRLG